MNKFIIFLIFVLISSCGYPDIDDIPYYSNLKISYEDKKTIRSLDLDRDEIIESEKEIIASQKRNSIRAHKQYGKIRLLGMKYK